MADKQISALTPAEEITLTDLFVAEQSGQAKSVSGQLLVEELARMLDGHGGISNISYTAPSYGSLNGTLTITLADNTTSSFTVKNGRGIASVTKTSTSGLTDVYTILYNDGTTSTFSVNNGKEISSIVKTPAVPPSLTDTYRINYNDGTYYDFEIDNGRGIASITWETSGTAGDGQTHTGTITYNDGTTSTIVFQDGLKGDTGSSTYVWIKYSAQEPVSDEDMGDTPDKWIGISVGTLTSAPTHYTDYDWYSFKGETGNPGVGITSITLDESTGDVDVYRVALSNGTNEYFTVTNGASITSITKTSTAGLEDTYTVLLTDGRTTTFTVTNAKSIVSVEWISNSGGATSGLPGTYDTYEITYNDGDTTTFDVYNGTNGTGSVSTVDGISPVNGDASLLTIGNGAPTTSTPGNIKSRYFDAQNSVLYVCVNVENGVYTWRGAGVTVDTSLSTTSTNPVQNKVIAQKVGTGNLSGFTATDLVGAANELKGEISGKVDDTGDTMTGDLKLKSSFTDGTPPSSSDLGKHLYFTDSNDDTVGELFPSFQTDGRQGVGFRCSRLIGGTTRRNSVSLYVDANNNKSVYLSNPEAWLEALWGAIEETEVVSEVVTAASGCSVTSAKFTRWGRIAQVYTVISKTAAVTDETGQTTIGTIISGKRPVSRAAAYVMSSTQSNRREPIKCHINATGGIVVTGKISAGQSMQISAIYIVADAS